MMLALTSPSSGESLGNPNNATITIIDDDPAPELALSAATYTVAEATPSVTVAITRSVNLSGPVSVRFATANGTASAGSDYTAVDEIVTFDTGESRKPITIQIREDEAYEGSEALSLSLSSPSGAILGNPPTATLTITDNDRATISFSRSSYSVSETGADAQITINRSGAMASAFAVRIATANGTASAGSDYTSLNEFVVFAARQSATTISISIRDDSLVEGNETILLALSNLSAGADLGNPGTATLTITDNDVAQTKGRIASAKLSKKVFTRAQARKVKLTVKFAPRSKLFRCVVSLKKGKKWVTVKSVKKTSFYKSRYTNTVKRLFAGKKLKKGAYRLRLSADKNSRTLSFRIR